MPTAVKLQDLKLAVVLKDNFYNNQFDSKLYNVKLIVID